MRKSRGDYRNTAVCKNNKELVNCAKLLEQAKKLEDDAKAYLKSQGIFDLHGRTAVEVLDDYANNANAYADMVLWELDYFEHRDDYNYRFY